MLSQVTKDTRNATKLYINLLKTTNCIFSVIDLRNEYVHQLPTPRGESGAKPSSTRRRVYPRQVTNLSNQYKTNFSLFTLFSHNSIWDPFTAFSMS